MQDYREKIKSTYNRFNGKDLSLLDSFYSPSVEFHDPVVNLKGLDSLKMYYQHAYSKVQSIRFDFSEILKEENKYSASWTMNICVKVLNQGKDYFVKGHSRLNFNESGLVDYHCDYLDLGEMVYERVPVQGFFIRAIKRNLKPLF
jgi:hypothetical protein